MISVGIDISKGKSTVCILKPQGEVVCKPFEIIHTEKSMQEFANILNIIDGEKRIVMEATGIYHLPVLLFLREKGYFVSVINPYSMKKFAKDQSLRNVKTDKADSIIIANYGIEKWYKLRNYELSDETYEELKFLGRRYISFMEVHIRLLQELTHLLDYTMPGIKNLFNSWSEINNKDKLSDFVEEFWHFDCITAMSKDEFVDKYIYWAKEKKYHQSISKAQQIYDIASDGIPTLSSITPSTKMVITETIKSLRIVNSSLYSIISRMKELAKTLPEYSVVRSMGGVGEVLSVKLIAEIGDVRRFHSGNALVAYAGIDPPPYESGQFIGSKRQISKRGSATLRKVGYEVMRVLKTHNAPEDDAVYNYIIRKESEGKNKKLAKIAGLNKFLKIYYARVMAVYQNNKP